jgi:hypothetical protein
MNDDIANSPARRPDLTEDRAPPPTGRRAVLLATASLLTFAAALAIGILLFGDFGSTEGRILATTALLAGYALVCLPAAMLFDRRQAAALAAGVLALALAAAALSTAAVWNLEGDTVGKTIGTLDAWLVAAVQPAALMLRSRERDPRGVRRLFAASCALVLVLAIMFTTLLWAEIDSERYGRVLGALVVLDVLLVALQPILARARGRGTTYRLRVVSPAGPLDLAVEAPDLAAAAAKAIRTAERDDVRVLRIEITDASAEPDGPARGVPSHEPAGHRPRGRRRRDRSAPAGAADGLRGDRDRIEPH